MVVDGSSFEQKKRKKMHEITATKKRVLILTYTGLN